MVRRPPCSAPPRAGPRLRGYGEIMGISTSQPCSRSASQTGGYEAPPYTDLVYSPPHIARLLEENGYAAEFR